MTDKKPQGPVVFDLSEPEVEREKPEAGKVKPASKATKEPSRKAVMVEMASATVDPSSAPMIMDEGAEPRGKAMMAVTHLAARPTSWITKLFWAAAVTLLTLYLTTAAWDFVTGLLARNIWLGRVAWVSLGVVGVVLVVLAFQEFSGFVRLSKIDSFRNKVKELRDSSKAEDAWRFSRVLSKLYSSRKDMGWSIERLKSHEDAVLDGGEILDLTERELMRPLDQAARREIENSARQVAAATALVPLALADVFVALTANIRMVRRIAEVYGGRSGTLGSWRLMRAVATHLVATGAVGVADDMISSVAGGGVVAKLSRRFGEGIVNGALTARVGLAAMDVCRPMPFHALSRPSVSSIIKTALSGMFATSKTE